MNDLQRFNVGGYGAMIESSEDGTWCRHEDVIDQIKTLEDEKKWLLANVNVTCTGASLPTGNGKTDPFHSQRFLSMHLDSQDE